MSFDTLTAARHALLEAALHAILSNHYAPDGPDAAAQAEYDDGQLALAARKLVRAVNGLPSSAQPSGWRPKATCCNGSGMADYAAVPCPNPRCPVVMADVCTNPCPIGPTCPLAEIAPERHP